MERSSERSLQFGTDSLYGARMSDDQNTTAYTIPLEITKRDDDRRLVFGFAKFSEDPENRGFLLVDRQGDVITPEDLETSAYSYVLDSRDAGEMHVTKGAASLVESVMITPEKLEAWGLPGDSVPIGWWTGYYVHEPAEGASDPWDKIVKGEYTAFSVEGVAVREEIAKNEELEELIVKCDGLNFDEDHALSRDSILLAARMGRITSFEAESLLEGLVESQAEVEEEDHAQDETETVLAVIRRLLNIEKHETGRPHPDDAHGNRLYSQAAEGVGNMMKQLKTRFKRVENETLQKMAGQFGGAGDVKSALAHDQVIAELVRRNLLPISKATFQTPRFQKLKEELAAAVTQAEKEAAEPKKEEEA